MLGVAGEAQGRKEEPVQLGAPARPAAIMSLERWRWMATPLALALGTRLCLFILADFAFRLIRPSDFVGSVGSWQKFDAVWYVHIAMYGYDTPPPNNLVDFFPLYPMTFWPLAQVFRFFGISQAYLVAGMLVSWVAFAAACVLLFRLAEERFGRAVATSAVLLLAVFPFSFFYGAAYTESLYLLTAVGAFYAIEHRRWELAALAAAIAGATRPPGIFLGMTVVLAYGVDWLKTRHGWRWDALWLALTPVGTLAYFLYCKIAFGDPLAYQKASERGWHGGHVQWTGMLVVWRLLTHPQSWLHGTTFRPILFGIYAVLLVVFLLALLVVYRVLGPVYTFFAFTGIVAPIATFPSPASTGRYLSVVFPAFIVAAYVLRKWPLVQQLLVFASSTFLTVFTMLFLFGFVD